METIAEINPDLAGALPRGYAGLPNKPLSRSSAPIGFNASHAMTISAKLSAGRSCQWIIASCHLAPACRN
jgi:hypothetical protein